LLFYREIKREVVKDLL